MQKYRVTVDVLNARSGPGTTFPVVGKLPRGAVLLSSDRAADGPWVKVTLESNVANQPVWVSAKYISRVDDVPDWFSVATRELSVDTREVPGPAANPRIVEYDSATTLKARSDEVPWCSAFVNWCMQQSGVEGTRSAAARSWLDWGQRLNAPRAGCVVVLRRGDDPSQGHVGFFVRATARGLDVLGGNQGNQVCIASYPKERVIGYRWPRG